MIIICGIKMIFKTVSYLQKKKKRKKEKTLVPETKFAC